MQDIKVLDLSYCSLQYTDIEYIASYFDNKRIPTHLILTGNPALRWSVIRHLQGDTLVI